MVIDEQWEVGLAADRTIRLRCYIKSLSPEPGLNEVVCRIAVLPRWQGKNMYSYHFICAARFLCLRASI